jgi:hypothetical protein
MEIMTPILFLKVLLLSVVVAAAALFVSTIISFTHGKSVDVKIEDAAKLDTMSYQEAMDYRGRHTIKLDFISTLKKDLVSPEGLFSFLGLFVPIFLTAIISANEALKVNRHESDKVDRDTSWIKRV